MGMFDNYDNQSSTYIPDNRVRLVCGNKEYKDTLVPGATCIEVFDLDLNYPLDVLSTEVYYKQGLSLLLTKYTPDLRVEVLADGSKSYLYVTLTPTDTMLFNEYNKDTTVQLKLFLADESVIYSKVYRLKVLPTLD